MSRMLSDLLNANEPMFSKTLRTLEAASGQPNIDVRLMSDIANKVRLKTKELGLDPSDTNGKELYYGLQSLIKLHNGFVAKSVGASDIGNNDLLSKVGAHVFKNIKHKNTWAIKQSVSKKLFKLLPPKRLMKHLSYRSVDSMLKREKIDDLYAGAAFVESAAWHIKFVNLYKKLTPADFGSKTIGVVVLDSKLYNNISLAQDQPVLIKEAAVLAVPPFGSSKIKGAAILFMALIVHMLNEARVYGAYLKLNQVKPNFGAILHNSIHAGPAEAVNIGGQKVHWRAVQLSWGKHKPGHKQEVFEPYLQSDDLLWQSSEDILYKLEPALKFWDNLDFVAANYGGVTVPLGLLDNALSYAGGLEYGQHSTDYFKSSLWSELYARYIGQETFEKQVISQLDSPAEVPDMMLAELEGIF